jgi:hypothetical protein
MQQTIIGLHRSSFTCSCQLHSLLLQQLPVPFPSPADQPTQRKNYQNYIYKKNPSKLTRQEYLCQNIQLIINTECCEFYSWVFLTPFGLLPFLNLMHNPLCHCGENEFSKQNIEHEIEEKYVNLLHWFLCRLSSIVSSVHQVTGLLLKQTKSICYRALHINLYIKTKAK